MSKETRRELDAIRRELTQLIDWLAGDAITANSAAERAERLANRLDAILRQPG